MKTIRATLIAALLLPGVALLFFSVPAFPSDTSLNGQWKGRWDNAFQCHFTIATTDNQNYQVEYRWEENKGQAFLKNDYLGKKVNSNTILAKNIYLVSHPTDKNRAIAIGIFDQKTRMAYLKRIGSSKDD